MPNYTESPGTFANDAANGGTIDWQNTGNGASSNNTYALAEVEFEATTKYYKCTNYGFAIPLTETITSIVMHLEAKASVEDILDGVARLVIGGTVVAGEKWLGLLQTSDETFQATWISGLPTRAQINAAGFGVAVAFTSSVEPADGLIDHVPLTIHTASNSHNGGTAQEAFFWTFVRRR